MLKIDKETLDHMEEGHPGIGQSNLRGNQMSAQHEQRVDGPTPNGGVYSIAYFSDAKGVPCVKERAANMEIVEYDKDDQVIFRTYGTVTPRRHLG